MSEIYHGLKIDWDELKKGRPSDHHTWLRYAERMLDEEDILETLIYITFHQKASVTVEEIEEVIVGISFTDDADKIYATMVTLVSILPSVFSAIDSMIEKNKIRHIHEIIKWKEN